MLLMVCHEHLSKKYYDFHEGLPHTANAKQRAEGFVL
jgi:hypothetical protein